MCVRENVCAYCVRARVQNLNDSKNTQQIVKKAVLFINGKIVEVDLLYNMCVYGGCKKNCVIGAKKRLCREILSSSSNRYSNHV